MHAFVVLNISFYQIFHIRKQSRVVSETTKDDHNQLFGVFIINDNTCAIVSIILKFSWIVHKERISFVLFIRLGTFFDMVLPEVFNRLRFYDPVVFRRIGGFQLFNIDHLDLKKI